MCWGPGLLRLVQIECYVKRLGHSRAIVCCKPKCTRSIVHLMVVTVKFITQHGELWRHLFVDNWTASYCGTARVHYEVGWEFIGRVRWGNWLRSGFENKDRHDFTGGFRRSSLPEIHFVPLWRLRLRQLYRVGGQYPPRYQVTAAMLRDDKKDTVVWDNTHYALVICIQILESQNIACC